MSSRGALARNGHVTTDEFMKKIGSIDIDNSKVLVGKGDNHGLPDYSHTPNRVYIKENSDNSFRELRVYGDHGQPLLEIAYHPEPQINNGNRHEKIFHYHILKSISVTEITRSPAEKLHRNSSIYKKFKSILRRYGL